MSSSACGARRYACSLSALAVSHLASHRITDASVQVRRERKLESSLTKLRKLCIEVGADDTEVAASVHPSLRNYQESMRGHFYAYGKPPSEQVPSTAQPEPVRNSPTSFMTFSSPCRHIIPRNVRCRWHSQTACSPAWMHAWKT